MTGDRRHVAEDYFNVWSSSGRTRMALRVESPGQCSLCAGGTASSCFLVRNCRSAAEQPLPHGRGSDGAIDNTRLPIGAATVRERPYAQRPGFAAETS